MRWLVIGSVLLLAACAGGSPELASPQAVPTPPAAATAVPTVPPTVVIPSATPRPQATPIPGAVSQPLRISSVGSSFFIAGVITGTVHVDSARIYVSIDEATFIHRDISDYKGSVQLISISAYLAEYAGNEPVLAFNETDPLPLPPDLTTRPGERVTVHDLRISISRAGAEQLERHGIWFRVDVRNLEPLEPLDRVGAVIIQTSPNLFAKLDPPPTMSALQIARVNAALLRTRRLSTYQIGMQYTTRDSSTPTSFGTPGVDRVAADYTASFAGTDSKFHLYGQSLLLHGIDPDRGLEAVTMNDRTYARGPLPLAGASEEIWYDMGSYPGLPLRPWYTADSLIQTLTAQVDPELLAPDGVETLDQQACTIYRAGRWPAMAALLAFAGAPQLEDEQAISQVLRDYMLQEASLKLWVCDDGYLHQLVIDELLALRDRPEVEVGLRLSVRVTRINGPVYIQRPSDAKLFVPEDSATPTAEGDTLSSGVQMTASKRANIYEDPHVLSRVVGHVAAGESVRLLERNETGAWYRILNEDDEMGWIRVAELPVERDIALQVPVAPTLEPTSEMP
jgi:hypothetical protein